MYTIPKEKEAKAMALSKAKGLLKESVEIKKKADELMREASRMEQQSIEKAKEAFAKLPSYHDPEVWLRIDEETLVRWSDPEDRPGQIEFIHFQ
jgi:hypothetical protein